MSTVTQSLAGRSLLAAALFSLALITAAPPARAQETTGKAADAAAAPQQNVLARVEFVGLKRVPREEALAAAGLEAGKPVDLDAVDQAASRLVDSGLFKTLNYNFRASKGQATVVFNVEEMASRAPVVFDNFVWLSDKDINEFIRKNVPGFDGTAPESGAVTDNIARILTQMLQLRGISGTVEYTPSADPSGRNPEHIFSVRGAPLRVCSVSYAGASSVKEETLVQNSAGVFSNEYSRQFVRAYAASNLTPLYRERGHLRAAFRTPTAKPTAAADSCSGVAVTVPVEEGMVYVWQGAEWTGNAAFGADELDAALKMTKRQVANGLKIDAGLDAVRKLYGRKGHLSARVAAAPNSTTRRAASPTASA
jgi:outer membrane protein assembly factor BamA